MDTINKFDFWICGDYHIFGFSGNYELEVWGLPDPKKAATKDVTKRGVRERYYFGTLCQCLRHLLSVDLMVRDCGDVKDILNALREQREIINEFFKKVKV